MSKEYCFSFVFQEFEPSVKGIRLYPHYFFQDSAGENHTHHKRSFNMALIYVTCYHKISIK